MKREREREQKGKERRGPHTAKCRGGQRQPFPVEKLGEKKIRDRDGNKREIMKKKKKQKKERRRKKHKLTT